MQALFFKIDFFFIPRKGMHTYTFLKMRKRSVTCGAFFNALQLIYRKKKETLLKRILDGSRKFQTPYRLIKIWQHKNKKQGRPERSAKQTLVFYFLVLPKYFWRWEVELLRAFFLTP